MVFILKTNIPRRKGLYMCFFLGLLAVMFITGCESNIYQSNVNLPQLKAEWKSEYAAWKSLGIQNYECIVQLGDTGITERITVRDGIFLSAIDLVRPDEPCIPVFETIDEIFDLIDEDFTTDENQIFSHGQIGTYFSVIYDPVYHYPVKYDRIDKYKKGGVDGNGLTIEIFEFTMLEE